MKQHITHQASCKACAGGTVISGAEAASVKVLAEQQPCSTGDGMAVAQLGQLKRLFTFPPILQR